jgi:hypothetical protein
VKKNDWFSALTRTIDPMVGLWLALAVLLFFLLLAGVLSP